MTAYLRIHWYTNEPNIAAHTQRIHIHTCARTITSTHLYTNTTAHALTRQHMVHVHTYTNKLAYRTHIHTRLHARIHVHSHPNMRMYIHSPTHQRTNTLATSHVHHHARTHTHHIVTRPYAYTRIRALAHPLTNTAYITYTRTSIHAITNTLIHSHMHMSTQTHTHTHTHTRARVSIYP